MTISIRPSVPDNLRTILAWLKIQYENDGDGFYCNRDIIRKAHEKGALTVLVENDDVVAFMVGDESSWSILEVRPNRRRRGYGRMLAQHYIEQAQNNDVCVLEIKCSPNTSIPFWKEMGFTLFPDSEEFQYYSGQSDAYMVFNKSFILPSDCPPVNVSIAFYSSRKQWERETEPTLRFSPDAVQVSADEILLSDRLICFHPDNSLEFRPFVGIEVDGESKYCDRMNDSDAEEIGVQCDKWGTLYLDHFILV